MSAARGMTNVTKASKEIIIGIEVIQVSSLLNRALALFTFVNKLYMNKTVSTNVLKLPITTVIVPKSPRPARGNVHYEL